jgi:NADPH2:quinone reductase
MRTVVCHELGPLDNLVIEEREAPVPREDQVVVRVRAAGVNFVDGLMCQGLYQIKPAVPFVPGSELAGEVVSIGSAVVGVNPGDRVVVFSGLGAFAEQVAVPALSVLPMPEGLTFAQAAALIQSYGTALFTLTRRTSVVEGETVLVLGAGGGVGLAVIDVARALGTRVIAAASTTEKLEAARAMGAQWTIAYEHEDLKARARALSDGGVDVVVDPVGGTHSEPALRALAPFGRFCVIGFAAGTIPTIPLNQVLLNNRTVVGVDWGGWMFRDPEGNQQVLAHLADLLARGQLHPTTPTEFPLSAATGVMSDLIDRSLVGKAVLVP